MSEPKPQVAKWFAKYNCTDHAHTHLFFSVDPAGHMAKQVWNTRHTDPIRGFAPLWCQSHYPLLKHIKKYEPPYVEADIIAEYIKDKDNEYSEYPKEDRKRDRDALTLKHRKRRKREGKKAATKQKSKYVSKKEKKPLVGIAFNPTTPYVIDADIMYDEESDSILFSPDTK